jgi:hypothetical protein
MKAGMTREDWIILRLIRAGVKSNHQLRFNLDFHRAVHDLLKRRGTRTVDAAIDQLEVDARINAPV